MRADIKNGMIYKDGRIVFRARYDEPQAHKHFARRKDHFIDWHLYREEIDALTGAKSVTFRLFTDKEAASNHCQCGNSRLVPDTMLGRLETVRTSR